MKKKDISANGALPSVWLSMVPIVVLVTLLYFAVGTFGTDTLSGASQLALLFSGGVAAALGIGVYRLSWTAIERSIVSGIGDVMPSVLILLVIGALSGAWMVSGIVPGFIYYGMKIIHPKFFLATACAVCAVVSIMTGSSWTTIATIGLALIGIGRAQGFEDGVVAGAIISGSYFGDKMSPLSDTTVLTASVSNTPLFTHIRYMMWTTVPAMILTLAIFTVLGISHETVSTEQMAHIGAGLASKFDISPWVFVVPVLTVVMIVFKTPSLVALFISASLGAVFALVFQTDALKEVAAGGSAIKGAVKALYGTASFGFSDKTLADLTESGGMAGMLNTVWLIICAMVFGGVMKVCRMLEAITLLFMRLIRGRTSMVSATVASGSFFNVVLADQYLAILLTGSMYMPIYRGKGYESRLLSRTTEDAVTVTSPLVPWSTCGMTQATMLSVPTIVYLPYSFFNLLCPLFTLALAATGIGIFRKK
ncbi:MAG: sodium:proton antiporter [Kiritimatiellae bacterium]|nr:sodium:proton antiporter [Kiritimatiellia bacterium]